MSKADAASEERPNRRTVAPCPWCGPGTELRIQSDGMGGQFVCCVACESRGPGAQIVGDFSEADAQAIEKWSTRRTTRPPIDPAIRSRVVERIQLQRLISGGAGTELDISLPYGDIARLLAAVSAE